MGDLRNDIEKYLRGELSPAERHALEKRALNDPFLADALEGADSISMDDFSADLKSLQQSLTQRTRRDNDRKVIPFWSWTMRIAAGLLIVAVAGLVVYQIANNKTNVQIAQTDPSDKEKPAQNSTESTSADSSRTGADEQKPVVTENSAVAETPKPSVAEKPKATRRNDLALAPTLAPAAGLSPQKENQEQEDRKVDDVTPLSSQPVIVQQQAVQEDAATRSFHYNLTLPDSVTTADVTMERTDKARAADRPGFVDASTAGNGVIDNAKKEAIPASAPVTIRAREKEATVADTKVIRGKVVSADDGMGLPGVNVTIKGTDVGTITDAEGNYQITIEPSVSGLVFSFIGMESQEVKLEDATQVNVALNQDMTQLSEVVVTGYGMEADEDTHGRITFATPSGGRAAFKKYIESNMQYPEQALVNEVEGRVTIQFTVESSGALSEIKVIRGIGYGCEEEVIRLIKQGPKWNPTRRDDEPITGKVKVRVRFKLPKK